MYIYLKWSPNLSIIVPFDSYIIRNSSVKVWKDHNEKFCSYNMYEKSVIMGLQRKLMAWK